MSATESDFATRRSISFYYSITSQYASEYPYLGKDKQNYLTTLLIWNKIRGSFVENPAHIADVKMSP